MSAGSLPLTVAAADPRVLAEFWAGLLGWRISADPAAGVSIHDPVSGRSPELRFVAESAPKTGQNRIHLDVASTSTANQKSIVDSAIGLGARHADIGQDDDLPWQVLADPAGNEFCVLEPRAEYSNTGRIAAIVVCAAVTGTLADFWATALNWETAHRSERYAGLRAPGGTGPWLEFLPEPVPNGGPDRIRLGLAPVPGEDRSAAIARLRALGAVPTEHGWLADPAGNEFHLDHDDV